MREYRLTNGEVATIVAALHSHNRRQQRDLERIRRKAESAPPEIALTILGTIPDKRRRMEATSNLLETFKMWMADNVEIDR